MQVELGGYRGHAGVRRYLDEVGRGLGRDAAPRRRPARGGRPRRDPGRLRGARARQRRGLRQPDGVGAHASGTAR